MNAAAMLFDNFDNNEPQGHALIAKLLATHPSDPHAVLARRWQIKAGDLDWIDAVGTTLLTQAVQNLDTQAVWLLLALGADANAFDARGMGPLHYAVMLGDIALMISVVLLAAGASMSLPCDGEGMDGMTALHLLAQSGEACTVTGEFTPLAQILMCQGGEARWFTDDANPDSLTPAALAEIARIKKTC